MLMWKQTVTNNWKKRYCKFAQPPANYASWASTLPPAADPRFPEDATESLCRGTAAPCPFQTLAITASFVATHIAGHPILHPPQTPSQPLRQLVPCAP